MKISNYFFFACNAVGALYWNWRMARRVFLLLLLFAELCKGTFSLSLTLSRHWFKSRQCKFVRAEHIWVNVIGLSPVSFVQPKWFYNYSVNDLWLIHYYSGGILVQTVQIHVATTMVSVKRLQNFNRAK